MSSTDSSYPIEELAADLYEIGRITLPARDGEDTTEAVFKYFESRSKDPKVALWRMMRCNAAGTYWEKHKEHFDHGDLSVVGVEKALISRSVIFALWVCWTRDDCDPITYSPPISTFISVCEGLAERDKARANK